MDELTFSRMSEVLLPMVAARLQEAGVSSEALYRDMRADADLMAAALMAAAAEEALDQIGSQLATAVLGRDEPGRERWASQRERMAALLEGARGQVRARLDMMGRRS